MSSVQMVQKYLFYNFEFPCSAGKTWSLSTKKNFSPFCSASPEIIGVKVCNRWTDRQTDKVFDAIYWGMWIFSFS